jgi:hypothetical protein
MVGREAMIGAFLLGVLTDAVFRAASASSREYRQEFLAYLAECGLTRPAPPRELSPE